MTARRGTLLLEDLVQYPDYGFVFDLTAAAIPIGAGSASVYEFEAGLATRIVADIQATFDGATNLTGLVLALEVSADAPTVVGRRWAPVRLVNAATDVTLATIVPGGGASQAVYVYASNARGALYCRLLAYGAGVAGAAADHLRVRLGVG